MMHAHRCDTGCPTAGARRGDVVAEFVTIQGDSAILRSELSRFRLRPAVRLIRAVAAVLLLLAEATATGAATVDSKIVWLEGKPQLEIAVTAESKAERKEILVPIDLWDAQEVLLQRTALKVSAAGPGSWKGSFPLEKVEQPKKQHRLVVAVLDDELGLDHREDIFFSADPSAKVQGYGLLSEGAYPARKVYFTLGLAAFQDRQLRDIPASLVLRDSDDNVVFSRQMALRPSDQAQRHRLDVTPDAVPVGPFKLEVTIDSEGHGLYFNASVSLAHPNTMAPFSGMEHGDSSMWFASDKGNPDGNRSYETAPPGSEVLYYSTQLQDLLPNDSPRLSFDKQEKHSGRQSLRIDYPPIGASHAWSTQSLPGKPLYMSFWVKGNESQDQLVVHFEDNINYTAPAWQRWAHFSSAVVGKLDFAGWRQFRVPVLGYGQQVSGTKGSTTKIDAPIRLLAFSIKPARLAKDEPKDIRRTIWIDDLVAETQLPATSLLSMECQASDPAGRLAADGKLAVSVGNGHAAELKRGRITLLARDAGGNAVWTATQDLPVPAGGFAATEVALAELAAKKPLGPVDIEITFQDAAQPAARISRPLPLKAPGQAGILHDFEEPTAFSGFEPGKVIPSPGKIVTGGATGTGHALALPVSPGDQASSVLFHPALPGVVDRVEMMVRGGAKPVMLQVWLIDSGYTGVWIRPYNLFWPEPIHVDWQGWRKVTVNAPPIPPYWGDKRRYFYRQPWYPLNLALNARVVEDPPQPPPEGKPPETEAKPPEKAEDQPAVEIRIDDVRVVTHLPEAEWLRAEIDYQEENRIHAPGSPLRLTIWNYGAQDREVPLSYKLTSYQGRVARTGKLQTNVPAGAKHKLTLLENLPAGIYDLEVQGLGSPVGASVSPQPETPATAAKPLTGCIMVLDARTYFGEDQAELLSNPHLLRRRLGLTTERVYLDWDNSEPAPYLFHTSWFENELKLRRSISLLPKELQPLAEREATAVAAVKEKEQELLKARQSLVNVHRTEKPAIDRLETNTKNLETAKTELETARKNLEPLVAKSEAAAKELADIRTKHGEATKAAQQADQAQTAAQTAVTAAERKWQEADRLAKAAQAPVKPSQVAADAAAKALAVAEEELKKLEAKPSDAKDQKPDPRPLEAARQKLQAARKQAETTKSKADEARRLLEMRVGEAEKLKSKLDDARKELQRAAAAVPLARKAADQLKEQAAAAGRNNDTARTERSRAEKAFGAANTKADRLEKTCDSDRLALADRRKAIAEALAKITETKLSLEAVRSAAAAETKTFEAARSKYDFTLLPVVGFCADWAGPEAADALEKGAYARWVPNVLQVPRRMIDWSLFVREIQREYRGRFDHWVFWENPDLDDAPQGVPPKKYAEMLAIFARWVKLYNPQAKVVAGGLNFSKSVGYLRRIPDVDRLPIDQVHVQMHLGELSPEHADIEGYLDDLNALLRLPETKRTVRITELDWGIGPLLSPMQQAAHHARATLILASRGVDHHEFSLINTGFAFDGYGVFYRASYGNSPEVQGFKPIHIPKPSFFALIEARKFLKDWQYVTSVSLSDRSLGDNRAYVYRNAAGELTVALWRAVDGSRSYRVPAGWQGAQACDVFGFPVALDQGLPCLALPVLVRLPAGYNLDQLVHDLRMIQTTDGSYPVLLDLHVAEPDSQRRAEYQATGQIQPVVHAGEIAGDRKVRQAHLDGLESESFTFALPRPAHVLLRRRWFFEAQGQQLKVRLNDGPEQAWNLGPGQGNEPGVRETTLVLRACRQGANRVTIRYDKPGNCAGYRIEPLEGDHVPLVRWGVLNTRQTRGQMVLHASAVGTPLAFGRTPCGDGLGTHAVSFIEYPLDGQFRSFEVTVGIDGSTEGRGSAIFRIYVDGKERASSGVINGFSKPKTLSVDGLEKAQRLILNVTDAEDGNRDDLANWVDGKLFLNP